MLKIREYREKTGMNQKEFAAFLKMPHSTYNQWETGQREPDTESIKRIAEALNVSINDLFGADSSRPRGVKIPVLGRVAAGIPFEAVTDIEDYEEIDQAMAAQGEFFALRIYGDSMEPRFTKGDVVIVRKQEDVDDGDIAIVLVNGNDATCKKIKHRPEGVLLISTNPKYEPMFYSNKEIKNLPVQILGRVVELRAKF